MNNNLVQLHKNLSNKIEGFNVPLEQFVQDMQDEENLTQLHASLSNSKEFEGFNVPLEQFKADMGFKKKKEEELSQEPIEQSETSLESPSKLESQEDDIPWWIQAPASLAKSSAGFIAGVMKVPKLTMDAQDAIIDKIIPENKMHVREKMKKDLREIIFGIYAESFENISKDANQLIEYSKKLDKYIEQYDEDVFNSIKSGNYGDAAKQTINGIASSTPYLIAALMTGGIGIIGASSSGQQYAEIEDLEGMTQGQKITNALAYGGTEALSEVVTRGLLNKTIKAFKLGELTEDAVKNFSKKLAEGLLDPASEGFSEGTATLSQNIVSIVTGEDPDRNVFEGIPDAVIIGTTMGVGMKAVETTGHITTSKARKKLEESAKKIEEYENGKVDNEVIDKEIQNKQKQEINNILDIVAEQKKDNESLSDEQLTEVVQKQNVIDEIDNELNNPDLTEEQVNVLNRTKKTLSNEIDEVFETAKKEAKDASKKEEVKQEEQVDDSVKTEEKVQEQQEVTEDSTIEKKVEDTPEQQESVQEEIDIDEATKEVTMRNVDGIIEKVQKKVHEDADPAKVQERQLEDTMGYLQQSEWYENASDVQREFAVREVRKKLGIKEVKAPSKEKMYAEPSKTKKVVDEAAALKDQIRLEAKAAREGAADIKDNVTRFKDRTKEIFKDYKGKLSGRQIQSINNKMEKALRSKKESAIDEAADYAMKVAQSESYAEDIRSAQSSRKKIRPKDSRWGNMPQEIAEFKKINPSKLDVEGVKAYNQQAKALLKGKVPDTKNLVAFNEQYSQEASDFKDVDKAKNVDDIKKLINDVFSKDVDGKRVEQKLSSVSDYRAVARKLGAIKNKAVELFNSQDIYNESTAQAIEEMINEVESRMEDLTSDFEAKKTDLNKKIISEAKESLEQIDKEDFSNDVNDKIEEFKSLDESILEEASPVLTEEYAQISEGLAEGFVNHRLYDFVDKVERAKWKKELEPVVKNVVEGSNKVAERVRKKMPKRMQEWFAPILEDSVGGLTRRLNLMLGSAMDGRMNTSGTKTIWETIITPWSRITTKMDVDNKETLQDFYESADGASAIKKKRTESFEKVGMILAQLDYQSNPVKHDGKVVDWKDLPKEAKDRMRDLFEKGDKTVDKEVRTRYENIWNKLPKDKDGNLDVEKAINSLSKNEKKMLESSRKALDSMKERNTSNAMKRGRFAPERTEYFPSFVLGAKTKLSSEIQNIQDWFTKGQTMMSTDSKSTLERVGTNQWIDLDISKAVPRHVREVNRDHYLTKMVKQHAGALSELSKSMEGVEAMTAKALEQTIKDRLAGDYAYKMSVSPEYRKASQKLRRWARYMALSKIWRPAIELTANTWRAVGTKGFNSSSFNQNMKAYEDIAYKLGEPIIEKISRIGGEKHDIGMSKSEKAILNLITLADTTIGKLLYRQQFDKAFKKLTGKEFNSKEYLENTKYAKEFNNEISKASSLAMKDISELFNAQSGFEAPPKMKFFPVGKYEGKDKSDEKAQFLNYMQSFTFNETVQTLNQVKNLAVGDKKAKTQAVNKIFNFAVSNFIYSMGMQAVGRMISAALDDDKEVKDAFSMFTDPKEVRYGVFGATISLLTSRYSNVLRPIIGVMLGMFDELGEDKQWKDDARAITDFANEAMFYKPIKGNTAIEEVIQTVPVFGDVVNSSIQTLEGGAELAKKVNEHGIESLTLDEKESWQLIGSVMKITTFLAPNMFTPTLEYVSRKGMYGTYPDREMEPTKNKEIVKEIRKVNNEKGWLQVPQKKNMVFSKDGGDEIDITDAQREKWFRTTVEMFSEYFDETVNAVGITLDDVKDISEKPGSIKTKNYQSLMQKDWERARKQAKYDVVEYADVRKSSQYASPMKWMADKHVTPSPITSSALHYSLTKKANEEFIKAVANEVRMKKGSWVGYSEEDLHYAVNDIASDVADDIIDKYKEQSDKLFEKDIEE